MKKIFMFLILFAVFVSRGSVAQELQMEMSDKVLELGQQSIDQLVRIIYEKKDQYQVLENIHKINVSLNDMGYTQLDYLYEKEIIDKKIPYYRFFMTFSNIKDEEKKHKNVQKIKREFPLLGIKFYGYDWTKRSRKPFKIESVLDEALQPLVKYQQTFLPYQLKVVPEKDTISDSEDISFFVELHNIADYALKLRKLSSKTVSIYHNGKLLPRSSGSEGGYVVVESGEFTKVWFRIEQGPFPVEVHTIKCVYLVSHEGVTPFAEAIVKME